jgi:hypothetical protein
MFLGTRFINAISCFEPDPQKPKQQDHNSCDSCAFVYNFPRVAFLHKITEFLDQAASENHEQDHCTLQRFWIKKIACSVV